MSADRLSTKRNEKTKFPGATYHLLSEESHERAFDQKKRKKSKMRASYLVRVNGATKLGVMGSERCRSYERIIRRRLERRFTVRTQGQAVGVVMNFPEIMEGIAIFPKIQDGGVNVKRREIWSKF